MPPAVFPIDGGLEAPRRCWWLVRPASRIAVRTGRRRLAAIVTHWLVQMFLANPTHAAAASAWFRSGHAPR
jgi:hypothetical protein